MQPHPSVLSPSKPVTSNQPGPHPRLLERVRRHLAEPWRQPVPVHALQAWARIRAHWCAGQALILDSACGTGESTLQLAQRHPDALVVGIDQSAQRLAKPLALPANALRLRTDAPALWRVLAQAGVRLERHYLLYPNPWPKAEHLQRRWHGHPAFGALLRLGGTVELRTNWRIYAEEFASALRLCGVETTLEALHVREPLTPFEHKYAASGHPLWRVQARLTRVTRVTLEDHMAQAAQAGTREATQAGNTPVDR